MTISPRSSLANSWPPHGTILDRDRAAHAFLDQDTGERQPMHKGVALNLTALNVEAFALGCLSDCRDPAVAPNCHFRLCQLVSLRFHMPLADGACQGALTS